ncbi:hypothetical protein LCGC14_0075620 [marine sediment metagenome]|uniref:ABC transporter domain-containing protein n=2 Tax=root TaxID=1 RepID=A0A0F9VJN9_9ZZZZ
MSTPLIELNNARYRISARNVLRVDALALFPGQHWCVFGGNGAGKSMLAALLSGRLCGSGQPTFADGFDPRADICEVSFAEQKRWWQHDDRHDVSEFSTSATDAGTTVSALICSAGIDPLDTDRLNSVLTLLDIAAIRNQGIRFLSSGQVRRALLARALYRRPKLLILDNPLESIDRISANRIREAIECWMSADNCTLQLSRRRRDVLPGITHLALMHDLVVTAVGMRDEVFARSADTKAPGTSWMSDVAQLPAELPAPCVGYEQALAAPGQSLISLRGVSAAYGDKPVFSNLHWEMKAGQHVLIAGPNGSGKSTLLGLIDGDNHKAYGQPVYLFGRLRGTGETVWQIKARFGVVSNELHNRYIKGWRALDVVVSGFFDSQGLYDDSGAAEASTAQAWLKTLGLGELARAYYHELSFGEQRLVLLARAMVKQPWVLVLDEASVGLDDHHRGKLLAMLDLIAKRGRTHIIYISHDDEECPVFINQKLTFYKSSADAPAAITVQEIGAGQCDG